MLQTYFLETHNLTMFDVLNSYLFSIKALAYPGLSTIFLERLPANTETLATGTYSPIIVFFRFDKYFRRA